MLYPISFIFQHTHPGIVKAKSPPREITTANLCEFIGKIGHWDHQETLPRNAVFVFVFVSVHAVYKNTPKKC